MTLNKPRCENKVANALSRREEGCLLAILSTSWVAHWEELQHEIDKDSFYDPIKEELHKSSSIVGNYSLVQGNLLFKGRLVFPINSKFIPQLLHEYHSGLLGDILACSRPSIAYPVMFIGGA